MPIAAHFPLRKRGALLRRLVFVTVAAAGATALGCAQVPAQPAAAEIATASVRWQCRYFGCRQFFRGRTLDPRHFECSVCAPEAQIMSAYGLVNAGQLTGAPSWTNGEGYRIEFTTKATVTPSAMLHELLPQVLARCFALRVKRNSNVVAGYALTIASRGTRFRAVKQPPQFQIKGGMQNIATIAQLVAYLNQFYYDGKLLGMTRPVVDATGLTGYYDIWVPVPDATTSMRAVIRDLGLEARTSPVTTTTVQILHITHLRTSCAYANP